MAYNLIGKDFVPPDVVAKVTGRAKYAEDFRAEGMLFCKLLLSPMPHCRVRGIDAAEALAMPGVKGILTADDLPPLPKEDGEDSNAVRLKPELALTREQQARGLMWRTELADDAGMLFVFDRAREQSFWMRNTPLPLDIIYIGADSKVVSVAANTVPYSQISIPSDGPAQYVLEVNAGFAREHGIGPGTRVELPDLPAREKNPDR